MMVPHMTIHDYTWISMIFYFLLWPSESCSNQTTQLIAKDVSMRTEEVDQNFPIKQAPQKVGILIFVFNSKFSKLN